MNYTKQLYSSLFLFIALFFIQSCENEPLEGEFGNGEMPASAGNFQVDFNGSTFQTNQVGATVLDNMISIGAISGDEAFAVALMGNSEGTYQLGLLDLNNPTTFPNLVSYMATQNPAQADSQTWDSANPTNLMISAGEVVITNIDYQNNTISGTFSFTGYNVNASPNSIEFTNGSFTNVSFEDELPNNNPNGNEFYAEIDGVEFEEDVVNVDASSGFSIGISGTTNALETISVSLPSDITVGSYPFSMETQGISPFLYVQYYDFNDPSNMPFIEGTIQVTTHDLATGHLVGSFNCSGEFEDGSTMTISNGSFDVYY
ncbi:DUF6252 family protein [Mangrovimonas futianensis]|uniref:DUF6252 family protein n=1 Tax=Mangrovimonas futianensis TaxID=2895523 RepID=UPI001E3B3DC2|nr:DUF6252 family protein [Mangrovimonas futianensis]MCF1423005.1 DUF6252 family protein [Mangrovimonas futianensis]